MKVFAVAVLTFFCVASINAVPKPYVQDGEVAEKNEFSAIVLALARVGDQRAVFGGGSIISKRHILTAAHLCVGAKEFRIGYGSVKSREVVRVQATSAFIHSSFNSQTLENDIAIITLPQNQLIKMDLVKPIAIAKTEVQVADQGAVASFGFESNESNTISEHLMIGRQVVVEDKACADAFGRAVHANQFCGQDPKTVPPPPDSGEPPFEPPTEPKESTENSDAMVDDSEENWPASGWSRSGLARLAYDDKAQSAVCRGDTGSAIVRQTDQGIVAFGVVSRVPQGCNTDKPALYTRLPAFYQWLKDATNDEVQIVSV